MIKSPSGDRPVFAAWILVGGLLVMSFADNLVRLFSDSVNVWQFHLIRAIFALPMIALLGRILAGQTIFAKSRFWVGARAVVMAVSMLLFFASIPMLPIAQCTAGMFTAPLFVLLFSALFLNEPVGPRRIGAVLVGFCGALVILQPFGDGFDWRVMLPVAAGFCLATGSVITRQRCRDESPIALLFANFAAFAVMGVVGSGLLAMSPPSPGLRESAPFLFDPWQTPRLAVIGGIAAMALAAVIGVMGTTRAYQLAQASFLTLFEYSYVISANIFAWILWSEVPPLSSAIGVAMIVGAGAYIALRGQAADVEPQKPTMQNL